jgi:hypothetical protein
MLLALGAAGIAYANGGDSKEQLTGTDAEKAKSTAIAAVGGGRAEASQPGPSSYLYAPNLLEGQFCEVHHAKLSEAHCSVGPRHVWTLGSIKTLWHTIMRRRG